MDFFSKCDFFQFPADLVTFTSEILNGKLPFCAVPIKAKKTHSDSKYTSSFFTLSESKRLTNLQKQQPRKTFFPVCMLQMLIASMNVFIPRDNWKILFFIKICCYFETSSTAILLVSLKHFFFERSPQFCVISLIIVLLQSSKIKLYLINFRNLFYVNIFQMLLILYLPG